MIRDLGITVRAGLQTRSAVRLDVEIQSAAGKGIVGRVVREVACPCMILELHAADVYVLEVAEAEVINVLAALQAGAADDDRVGIGGGLRPAVWHDFRDRIRSRSEVIEAELAVL